jgi:hypothetical protein
MGLPGKNKGSNLWLRRLKDLLSGITGIGCLSQRVDIYTLTLKENTLVSPPQGFEESIDDKAF